MVCATGRGIFKLHMQCTVSSQHDIVTLVKAHTRYAPSLRSLQQIALVRMLVFVQLNLSLNSHLGRTPDTASVTSHLHSSFLQTTRAVMLWPVLVPIDLQISRHYCKAVDRSFSKLRNIYSLPSLILAVPGIHVVFC